MLTGRVAAALCCCAHCEAYSCLQLFSRFYKPPRNGTRLSLWSCFKFSKAPTFRSVKSGRDIFVYYRDNYVLLRAKTCSPEMIGFVFKWESLRDISVCGLHHQNPGQNAQANTSESLRPQNIIWMNKNSKVKYDLIRSNCICILS